MTCGEDYIGETRGSLWICTTEHLDEKAISKNRLSSSYIRLSSGQPRRHIHPKGAIDQVHQQEATDKVRLKLKILSDRLNKSQLDPVNLPHKHDDLINFAGDVVTDSTDYAFILEKIMRGSVLANSDNEEVGDEGDDHIEAIHSSQIL
ncbi:hypothetical protein KIN20_009405, partial [Parelaphostrongylus tenuis]